MNERIRELMAEADRKCSETRGIYDEILAQLIVQECAQICRNQPNVYALKADRDNCAIAIEQHFGVEL
jgi:hypothetical protein